jgi:hypothetical protein
MFNLHYLNQFLLFLKADNAINSNEDLLYTKLLKVYILLAYVNKTMNEKQALFHQTFI